MNCNSLQVRSICTVYDNVVYHPTFGAGVTGGLWGPEYQEEINRRIEKVFGRDHRIYRDIVNHEMRQFYFGALWGLPLS